MASGTLLGTVVVSFYFFFCFKHFTRSEVGKLSVLAFEMKAPGLPGLSTFSTSVEPICERNTPTGFMLTQTDTALAQHCTIAVQSK